MNMKIRDAKHEDLPDIIDLNEKSMVPVWKKLKREYDPEKIENITKQSIGKHKLIVAEIDHRIVGCGRAKIYDDETSRNVICFLDMVLVHPDFQRKGIGKEIMRFLEDYGKQKGVTKYVLDVVVGNMAIDFYEFLGYKKTKVIMTKNVR